MMATSLYAPAKQVTFADTSLLRGLVSKLFSIDMSAGPDRWFKNMVFNRIFVKSSVCSLWLRS